MYLNLSFRDKFKILSNIYNKLGQFDYGEDKCTEDLLEKIANNSKGVKFIYIGQFEKGTNVKSGIGICVWSHGTTLTF